MKIEMIDWQGGKAGEIELPDSIFNVKPKMQVVQEAFLRARKIYSAPYGHVKTRSEVKGGGSKPWRQKGTGRARHGSTRSPLWRGGGVTHGPNRDRSFSNRLAKKQVKQAIKMLLTDALAKKQLKVISAIPEIKKTKEFFSALSKISDKKTLLVADDGHRFLAARNIPNVKVVSSKNLGVPQLLWSDTVLIEKQSIDLLTKRL